MRLKYFPSQKRSFFVLVSIIIFAILASRAYLYCSNPENFKTPEELAVNDETIVTHDVLSSNSSVLQAAEIYDEYRSNKVAFDKQHNEEMFEFEGTISDISNDFNCAKIHFTIYDEDDSFIGNIECSNCPAGSDKWSNEVAKFRVGDHIRVKGYYDKIISSEYRMSFYKCHIVE